MFYHLKLILYLFEPEHYNTEDQIKVFDPKNLVVGQIVYFLSKSENIITEICGDCDGEGYIINAKNNKKHTCFTCKGRGSIDNGIIGKYEVKNGILIRVSFNVSIHEPIVTINPDSDCIGDLEYKVYCDGEGYFDILEKNKIYHNKEDADKMANILGMFGSTGYTGLSGNMGTQQYI